MDREHFEQLITDAVLTVPEHIRARLKNLAFVVEDRERVPAPNEKEIIGLGGMLLGLYQGVPLIHRGAGYQYALPDKITIFRDNIGRLARGNDEQIAKITHDTVLHEIAHHIGFSEREVRAWESRRRENHG